MHVIHLFQNLIIISKAANKLDIRDPHDVMNLYPSLGI